MNYFYSNIEYIRKSNNLTQQALADKLNMDRSTISRWEQKCNGATIDSIINISEILNIPLSELIGRDLRVSDKNIERIDIQTAKNEIENILNNSDMSEQQKAMVMTPLNYISSEDDEK